MIGSEHSTRREAGGEEEKHIHVPEVFRGLVTFWQKIKAREDGLQADRKAEAMYVDPDDVQQAISISALQEEFASIPGRTRETRAMKQVESSGWTKTIKKEPARLLVAYQPTTPKKGAGLEAGVYAYILRSHENFDVHMHLEFGGVYYKLTYKQLPTEVIIGGSSSISGSGREPLQFRKLVKKNESSVGLPRKAKK